MIKCYDYEECEYNGQPDCALPDGAQCPHGVPTVPPVTNADKIRAMSDEELAEELVIEIEGLFPSLVYVPMATGNIYISRDKAEKEMLEYLQQPAEEETVT